MSVYGYIRVSSREQNEDRQLVAMGKAHVPKRNIFMENIGAKHVGRRAENLTGRVFGRLTVLERVENKNAVIMWKCRCSCGRMTFASSHDLMMGLKRQELIEDREGRKRSRRGNLRLLL